MNETTEFASSNDEKLLIVTLGFLAFILAPVTLAANILVIIPFCRCSRVRTASNQILLALAITDLLLGVILFMASLTGLSKVTKLAEPNNHMHISYAVAMSMATLQSISLMLMVANSGDKALSLLRPLHYNEIVTFTTVKAYIVISILVAISIGVVLPLTLNETWSEGHFHYFMVIPIGPTPEPEMQLNMMVFFTVPCGLVVAFCHFYVYTVANRHAKAIRRDDKVRDRMMTSVCYTTSEAGVVFGMDATVAPTSNYLTIPIVHSAPKPLRMNSQEDRKNEKRKSSSSSNSSNNSTSASRYGASLLIGVLVVFASRLPSELWSYFLFSKSNNDLQNQLFYLYFNIPLFLCSACNPWMYAYHNLDLKPVMKRLLRRTFRHLFKNNNQADQELDKSFFTNWQISVFASFSRRSSVQGSFLASHHQRLPRSTSFGANLMPPTTLTTPTRPATSATTPKGRKSQRCKSQCQRQHRRSSLGVNLTAMKTRRSKSCCTNRAIPTVTVWDGDCNRVTRPEDVV